MKNPVAKYSKINRASVQRDRKRAAKKGYKKHKNSHLTKRGSVV